MGPADELAHHESRLAELDRERALLLGKIKFIKDGACEKQSPSQPSIPKTTAASWKGTLVQYAGRLHRKHPGKKEVRIYDYLDNSVPMLMRMFKKRMKTYRALGYVQNDSNGLNL
jgi:hypothetical protein